MSSRAPENPNSLHPDAASPSAPSSLYPSVEMKEPAEDIFPEVEKSPRSPNFQPQSAPADSLEEVLVKIPGAIVHLIDKERSVELACGEFVIIRLRQGGNAVAVLARVGDEIQWPLAKDEAAVKLDESHYFFTLRVPLANGACSGDDDEIVVEQESEDFLNYGLTIASKGQESLLKELDGVLEYYSNFSVQKVNQIGRRSEALDGSVASEMSPEDMESEKMKELMEETSAAYWTTLAPNVEDYSGSVARMIAAGSAQLIKGILLCGDVTVDRLKWGNEFLKKRMGPGSNSEVSPAAMERIKRVKMLTKMTEGATTGILSGVVKVSGFITSSIVNSQLGKKFFSLLPGEIVLASLDGFNKVCDAIEVAGKSVMSTTSVVTTGLVSQRYGEQAAQATNQGLDAAGHVIGTAWAVFKIRKAINPMSVIKPTALVKSAAEANSFDLKT
ncbi:protein EARLY-RESPONSIVE TO DEHYDRATION 7, chloroplastic-like [Malania oleifera]|uniref:protein EARLY-RESPONSIVE TO DEHYDRATION 7, chloroplastic-like n=1 Tax=Malania oleifera TaxID=397392 RepID=UPI0025AE5B0D|nr:protein EARLY-RESPONSIVE TO DEHYDRATION 7, chloroplastic-like [Malania oleifera]